MELKPVKAGWRNAFRPWTLHGAVVPVLIGGAVALSHGFFNIWILALIAVGGCLLQSAANLLNTYGDFVRGTDTEENHPRSPELVTGALEPRKVMLMGLACLGATAALGLVFIWYSGWSILIIGLVGLAGAGLYTVGTAYKYHGLGLAGVFVMMGILMPLGTYMVLSFGEWSWAPVIAGLPNALLITAVLSGNETRDYHEDRKSGVGTFSGHLSYEGSMRLYLSLCTLPFVILVALVAFGLLPWPCLLPLLSLYLLYGVVRNSRLAPTERMNNILLVPKAFKLNWVFGLLLVIGYLIAFYWFGGGTYV
jgi:1,4-dihydroxy-2-naphthoate polyprenyltransferase